MKTKKIQFLLFCFLSIFQNQLSASCFGPRISLTEFLNAPDDKRSIMRVKIDSFFLNSNYSYAAFATVLEIFKGENIRKVIKINSGGLTTAGGVRLKKGAEYIVSSESKNGYEFNAFVCDSFSFRIKNGRTYKGGKYNRSRGDLTFEIFRQFFQLKKSQYTGEVILKNDEGTWAKGNLENGIAHGVWQNFDYDWGDTLILRSLVNYNHGKFEGVSIYYQKYGNGLLDKITRHENGQLVWEEIYEAIQHPNIHKSQTTEYFKSKMGKFRRRINFFKSGNKEIVQTRQIIDIPPGTKEIAILNYPHGGFQRYFQNGELKESGKFFKGAKVGIWTRYDSLRRNPPIIDTFAFPDTSLAEFVCFFEDGTPYIWGDFKDNKPEGKWNKFWDRRRKQVFNFIKGKLNGTSFYYDENGVLDKTETYKNNLLHGENISYHDDGKIIASIVKFKNGKKEGKEKQFNADGSLHTFGFYKNDLKEGIFTLFKNGKKYKTQYQRGYFHGGSERFIWHTLEVGEYHFNQKVGVWKYYSTSGKLQLEEFYPTVDEIYNWEHYSPRRTKIYDENGEFKNEQVFEDWMIGNLRKD